MLFFALLKLHFWCKITHVGPSGGHEDGKVCKVSAGAGGCVAVDVDGIAAVGGPAALQAVRLVLPEGALGHISFRVDGLQGTERVRRHC